VLSLIRSKDKGGGAWSKLVTRDCPNILVPTLAAGVPVYTGPVWTWGGYSQVHAGLAYDYLVCNLLINAGLGYGTSGNVGISVPYFLHYELATGASQSEVSIAQALDAMCFNISITGVVDDAVGIVVREMGVKGVPIGPVIVVKGTRISFNAVSDIQSFYNAGAMYVSGYDTATFAFTKLPFADKDYELGLKTTYSKPLIALGFTSITSGAANWKQGAYGQVIASLDKDYLIIAATAKGTNANASRMAQFDIALGAADSEVVQQRTAIASGTESANVIRTSFFEFKYPFIAYAGERLAIRAAASAASKSYDLMLCGIRLD